MMRFVRLCVCAAALAVALSPLGANAADDMEEHQQQEVANGYAQLDLAQQQVADLQRQAEQNMANERMIALLRSEAGRERQLSLVANANALEAIATDLANAQLAQGDIKAQNALATAQLRATALLVNIDANLANARQLAINKGRVDELANAQAQSALLHQVADFITEQASVDMNNEKMIAQARAGALQTQGIVEQQNGVAMGANALLAGDVSLAAGQLNATNMSLVFTTKEATVLNHAADSLRNALAMAAE